MELMGSESWSRESGTRGCSLVVLITNLESLDQIAGLCLSSTHVSRQHTRPDYSEFVSWLSSTGQTSRDNDLIRPVFS